MKLIKVLILLAIIAVALAARGKSKERNQKHHKSHTHSSHKSHIKSSISHATAKRFSDVKIKIEPVYENDKQKTKFPTTQEHTVTLSNKEKNEKTICVTLTSGLDYADKFFIYYLYDMFSHAAANKFCLNDYKVQSIENEKDEKNAILNFNLDYSGVSFKKYKIHFSVDDAKKADLKTYLKEKEKVINNEIYRLNNPDEAKKEVKDANKEKAVPATAGEEKAAAKKATRRRKY
jgi:hypothetical protein